MSEKKFAEESTEVKPYKISIIRFQREETSPWEPGLMINEGDRIFDLKMQEPKEVWDYKDMRLLSMDIDLFFTEAAKNCNEINNVNLLEEMQNEKGE